MKDVLVALVVSLVAVSAITYAAFDAGRQAGKLETLNQIDVTMVLENRILIERLVEREQEREEMCNGR